MDHFRSPAFAARVEALMLAHHVPGVSVAVTQAGSSASAGYGSASLDPPRACTADTLFDIASSSKSVTAAAVALLVEDDKHPDVKWDAPMAKLLPEDFVLPGREHGGATVEDLLSHRTGMLGHDLSYMGPKAARPDDARSVTRNLRNLAPGEPPRTKWVYCNMMFTVATHLVEDRSGLAFPDFVEERFFRPLGMASTHLQPERARAAGLSERIATGYAWDEDSQSYRSFQTPDCPEAQGAGSIMASASDYVRWVAALLRREGPITQAMYDGLVRQRAFLNPDATDLRPRTSPTYCAAGLEVYYYRGYAVVGHDGSVAGFASRHFFLPELDFGAVILANASGACILVDVVARELIDEVLNVPTAERPDWDKIEREHPDHDEDDGESPEQKAERLRQEMGAGAEPEPLKMPLAAYTGEYWNVGYKGLKVEERDGGLFVDASDRAFGITLRFEHVRGQTMFVAHERSVLEGVDAPTKAEFRFEGERAVRMGIHLEYLTDELIWWERVES